MGHINVYQGAMLTLRIADAMKIYTGGGDDDPRLVCAVPTPLPELPPLISLPFSCHAILLSNAALTFDQNLFARCAHGAMRSARAVLWRWRLACKHSNQ